jgi:Skp family chaperone for outer membrane proteins
MAGRHLRNRSIIFVEDNIGGRDSNEVDEISSFDNTAINQEAETVGIVMSEYEVNNSDTIVSTEVSVGMLTRKLQDLLTNAIYTLRSALLTVTEQLDSKLQAATENITAKIQQENEKLTQNLHNEVKKLSSDICNLRSDTEHKFQEATRTIGGISDALNERIDAHVIATRKITDRISQEMNARSGRLLEDMKEYRTEIENSLKEFRQDYILFREQVHSEQATWQN